MDKITAELDHPEIQGPPLFRGTRYGHHFVVELISDGRRLWAVASEEGRKILHQIERGIGIDEGPTAAEWVDAGYSAKNYPPSPYREKIKAENAPVLVGDQSGTGTGVVTDPANIDPNTAQPNLPPLPEGEAPTTTVSSANTFDS